MIISRTPLRISFSGGGTDLKVFYQKEPGAVVSTAIKKYVYITVNKRFDNTIRVSYSKTEIVDHVEEIQHPIIREALRMVGIDTGVEIVSIADVPAGTGLGSSSSFTVGLLNALYAYKGCLKSPEELAFDAGRIEIDILHEPIGKQDQYIAAFGGITCLTFEKNGDVVVEPLQISPESLSQLMGYTQFFYSGFERSASEILDEQDKKSKQDDTEMIENLHQIKEIGLQTRVALERGDIDEFGKLLDVHWETKKKRSVKMTDPFIDECYELACKKGALGGKIIGAGGGGFFMFYCSDGLKSGLYQTMSERGLKPVKFHLDFEGAKIFINM